MESYTKVLQDPVVSEEVKASVKQLMNNLILEMYSFPTIVENSMSTTTVNSISTTTSVPQNNLVGVSGSVSEVADMSKIAKGLISKWAGKERQNIMKAHKKSLGRKGRGY